jgi:hypothetical protein
MNAQDDNTAPSRTGMRRIIPRFEFRRLHGMARVRIGAGTVLVGLGVSSRSATGTWLSSAPQLPGPEAGLFALVWRC